MGFPAAVHAEVPRLLLNLLFLLDHLRRLSSWLLRLVGIGIQHDLSLTFEYPTASDFANHHSHHGLELELEKHSPAVRFDALSTSTTGDEGLLLPEGCAVCLADFHGAARVRRPRGCGHVFHRACLDRWAAYGHRTCPLCRAPLLSRPSSCHCRFRRRDSRRRVLFAQSGDFSRRILARVF